MRAIVHTLVLTHCFMSPTQLKFARFKSGPWGRAIDITLGIVLMWWGSSFGSAIEDLAFVIGVFALTAGVFNVCWLWFIVGIPFRGRDVVG